MKRIQLFEFEDQSWFPDWIRASMTKLIVVMNKAMGVDVAVANLLNPLLNRTSIKTVVDLGSGAGGAMPLVMQNLRSHSELEKVKLILTDLYPNVAAIEMFNSSNDQGIRYEKQSVDATNLSQAPDGIKTMINSFHHLSPQLAKSVLTSAKDSKQPILIFEMANNKIPVFVWALFLPLGLTLVFIMALLFTPFAKPSFKQLIFTYIIPIIPICYAWDGQASMPRIYSAKDIDILLEDLHDEAYQWTKGFGESKNGKKVGNYIIGEPVD